MVALIWVCPSITRASLPGTPRFLSSDPTVCRMWCTLMARIWLLSQMRWNDRSRLRGSNGRPVLVVKTSCVSGHADSSTLVSSLAVGLMLDCFAGEVEERQGTLAGVALDWCKEDLAVPRD